MSVPAGVYGLYLTVLAIRLSVRSGPVDAVLGALLTPVLHAAYGAGVTAGFLYRRRSSVELEIDVRRLQ